VIDVGTREAVEGLTAGEPFLADAAREGEPLAHALTGATIALLAWSAGRPDEPRELHALRLMNFAWMGLGNLVRGELWLPPTEEEQK